jgi:NADH:ubiquinone reductase (H+-translocating)
LAADSDRFGRVRTLPDLSVPGHPKIFAIGDTAHVPGREGKPLPEIAAVAKQQGAHVAREFAARLEGCAPPVFAYRDLGAMATIGRSAPSPKIGQAEALGRTRLAAVECRAYLIS